MVNNKRTIGFYCGECFYNHDWDENDATVGSLGGTETWVVEATKRLQNNYNVIVFNECKSLHICSSGVMYVPIDLFDTMCSCFDFEHFILMECIGDSIDLIKSRNIYYMPSCEDITYGINRDVLRLDKVSGIGYLSEWQKNFLKERYLVDDNQLFKHCYGVNCGQYNNIDFTAKENAMVWSSQKTRGLKFLVDKVLPKILLEVPDFKIYVCSYLDDNNSYDNQHVFFVGKKNKSELCELQKKAKIWVYPNYGLNEELFFFHETFCITAVENAMAQNAIVCLDGKDGLYTTLDGYSGLIDGSFFNEYGIIYDDDFEAIANTLAEETIKILKDDTLRISKVRELKLICEKYTWDYSYVLLLNELRKNEM